MKAYAGNGVIAPCINYLGSRFSRVDSFMPPAELFQKRNQLPKE
jgi:hypothetical protein